MINRLLCAVFAVVYRRWLWNPYHGNHDKVLRVTSWRGALIADGRRHTGRKHMMPCFWWFR